MGEAPGPAARQDQPDRLSGQHPGQPLVVRCVPAADVEDAGGVGGVEPGFGADGPDGLGFTAVATLDMATVLTGGAGYDTVDLAACTRAGCRPMAITA